MFLLVLAENRPPIWRLLQEVFSDEEGIELSQEKLSGPARRSDLDALMVGATFGYEYYGGHHRIGISEVLSTKGNPRLPPWIVTTAPFPAHIAEIDENDEAKVVLDDPNLTPREQTYIIFTKVFEAIERFNVTEATTKIGSLGCEVELRNFPLEQREREIRMEFENIRRAYHEHSEQLFVSMSR